MGNTRYQPTFMLTDIYQIDTDGKEHYVADHLWMNLTKLFLKYGWLEKDGLVQFDGKVVEYMTQKKNDFKIERPSKVIITRSGIMLPHTGSLINLKPLEIEQEINLQNRPYTLNKFNSDMQSLTRFFERIDKDDSNKTAPLPLFVSQYAKFQKK
ncbi:hypothetical protein [Listeria grayi]|uniref:hypothetical protein n=1 Tax=Listeria grayi TaxID=1641 RepID=UPI001628EFCE|nr:hypothetical protein [Listeria grayi]MBC1920963.1 hypothetical protein [Listeria grayi]